MPLQDGKIAVAIAESTVAKASAQTRARVMRNFMVLWDFLRCFDVLFDRVCLSNWWKVLLCSWS